METTPPPRADPRITRELLERYLGGDGGAGTALFARHRELLVRRAHEHPWMAGLGGQTTPEDAVHEVLLRALSSGLLVGFDDRGRGSLRNALFRILDRVLADAHRRRGSLKRGGGEAPFSLALGEDADTHGGVTPPPTEDPTPTGEARANELVRLCRERLAPKEWEVWRMIELEGLDSVEASRRLGSTDAAVRGVLHRARRKVLAHLARALEEPRDP